MWAGQGKGFCSGGLERQERLSFSAGYLGNDAGVDFERQRLSEIAVTNALHRAVRSFIFLSDDRCSKSDGYT